MHAGIFLLSSRKVGEPLKWHSRQAIACKMLIYNYYTFLRFLASLEMTVVIGQRAGVEESAALPHSLQLPQHLNTAGRHSDRREESL